MKRFFGAVALDAMLFVCGWSLVVVSGFGGNRTEGSRLVWNVGGLMVYLSVLLAPLLLLGGLAVLVVRRAAHR